MNREARYVSRGKVGAVVGAVVLLCLALFWGDLNTIIAQQSNFMGGSPEVTSAEDVRSVRIYFPPGVRSNWHTHTWGQLLMLEEGRGRHQVRGQPVEEMTPGHPWWTPAGVEHWHGAAPGEGAHQLTIYAGSVNWLEPVSDADYGAPLAPAGGPPSN